MNKRLFLLLIGLIIIYLIPVTALADNQQDVSGDIKQPVSSIFDQSYLFSLSVPLWYDFKTADDGQRFKQRDATYGIIAAVQIHNLAGIGLEYYEIPILNPDNNSALEKDSIVHTIIDLIYLVPIIDPFNLAVGIGYGQSKVIGNNADRFDTGKCYQWFIRGGLVLSPDLQIHMGYHDVYSQIPFKNDTTNGIEAGGKMYAAGISVSF